MPKQPSIIEELIAQSTSPFDDLGPAQEAKTDMDLGLGKIESLPPSEGEPPPLPVEGKPPLPAVKESKAPERGAIIKAITEAAKKHGVDPARLLAMAMHESSLNPNAKNEKSGAKGLFQALPAWAKDYGITGREFVPEAAADAAARSIKASAGTKNPYITYLIHNQGRKGAELILRAAAGEAPLPEKIKRNILAQPMWKGKAPKDSELAQTFLAQQRKRFMSHYTKAQQELGAEATKQQELAKLPSSGINWDELLSKSQQDAAAVVSQEVATGIGPGMPRVGFGGKV